MKIVSLGFNKQELNDRFNIDGDITFLDNLNDISKYKADILIINLDNMPNLYDILSDYDELKYKKYDLYEFDRMSRKMFNNHKKVFIISLDDFFHNYKFKSLYSNIYFINSIDEINCNVEQLDKKKSRIKNNNIEKLKEYVDKQVDYFDSKNIMKAFNVSNRWIKRYMKDMNDIYNNIGYSYVKRKWYKIKER